MKNTHPEERRKMVAEEALALIELSFKFGKRLYKDRCELYER